MKILFTTALIIAAVTSLVHAQEELGKRDLLGKAGPPSG